MPKTPKHTGSTRQSKGAAGFHSTHPWKCKHGAGRSEILAYVEASGNWETVLTVHPAGNLSAEETANFIAGLVNDRQNSRNLLLEAMRALEAVLEDGRLTYASEQDADSVIGRIKKSIA